MKNIVTDHDECAEQQLERAECRETTGLEGKGGFAEDTIKDDCVACSSGLMVHLERIQICWKPNVVAASLLEPPLSRAGS